MSPVSCVLWVCGWGSACEWLHGWLVGLVAVPRSACACRVCLSGCGCLCLSLVSCVSLNMVVSAYRSDASCFLCTIVCVPEAVRVSGSWLVGWLGSCAAVCLPCSPVRMRLPVPCGACRVRLCGCGCLCLSPASCIPPDVVVSAYRSDASCFLCSMCVCLRLCV